MREGGRGREGEGGREREGGRGREGGREEERRKYQWEGKHAITTAIMRYFPLLVDKLSVYIILCSSACRYMYLQSYATHIIVIMLLLLLLSR